MEMTEVSQKVSLQTALGVSLFGIAPGFLKHACGACDYSHVWQGGGRKEKKVGRRSLFLNVAAMGADTSFL